MPKINPFRPNCPVNPGMFVGRLEEVERLKTCLIQTRSGRFSNFMITGERGIGKSSLLNYATWLAQGYFPSDGNTFKFVVIDTVLDTHATQLGLIRKIEVGLRKELEKTERARTFFKKAWEFLQRVEAAGISIKQESGGNNDTIIDEFSYTLAEISERLRSKDDDLFEPRFDGMLIMIDEADSGPKTLELGSFLKSLSERLQRRGCDHIMFGLAGFITLRDILLQSHLSSLRLFEEIKLKRLTNEEIDSVINICLKVANDENEIKTSITDDARRVLINLSEGYPHFIQQFGYSAFAEDKDNTIDFDDVLESAFGPGKALEQIGDTYYRDAFYNKIQKESYRQVLRIMAQHLDSWVTKQQIRHEFKGKDDTLNNALKALLDRHIILPKEGERGKYRLQHKGFAWWIKACTVDPENLHASLNGKDKNKKSE